MASWMRSWRKRSRSPSSSTTRARSASASTDDSSRTDRPVVADRSVSEKLDPRMEAGRSASRVSSGRKLRRRRMVSRRLGGRVVSATSARPWATWMVPSCSSAASSSVTNSGLPPAAATSAMSLGPGSAPTAPATSSAMAPGSSWPRVRRRAPAASRASSVRSSSAPRGSGRRLASSATGLPVSRRASAPRVSRLEGSAHWRSSRPSTSGPRRASASTSSRKASTAWNCRPGSLLTVATPRSPSWVASRAAMAARRGSGDDREQPRLSASRPKGRLRSRSWPRPATTSRPRSRAASSASASRRDLPIPASPSTTTMAGRPPAARPRASTSVRSSTARPRRGEVGASVAMRPCYASPLPANPAAAGPGWSAPVRPVAVGRADHLGQRPQQAQPARERNRLTLGGPGRRFWAEDRSQPARRGVHPVQGYPDLHAPRIGPPARRRHRPAGGCLAAGCFRGYQRPAQVPMATGRPAAAWSRAVIPAQPGVGAAAAGE
jgi:hypothetical protein